MATKRVRPPRDERGAAVVDFVLVLVLLMPLFLGILQVALVLHVRNTVQSAAAEGARAAAAWGGTPADGVATAHSHWRGAVRDEFVRDAEVEVVQLAGAPAYRLHLDVAVPALGLGGPAVAFRVSGTAVLESDPTAAGAP